MTKYSNEFKVKAIKMVLKGNSISHVAKILNMPDIAPLYRWISHYEHGGIPQLLHKNRCADCPIAWRGSAWSRCRRPSAQIPSGHCCSPAWRIYYPGSVRPCRHPRSRSGSSAS